jgi:hypothetical protein
MPLLWKRLQIAAKTEVAEGTAIALTATEAILANNVSYDPEIKMTARAAASSSLSPYPKVAGSRQAKLTFDVDLKGSGTAGTAPEFGVLLKACGMTETIVAVTSVTYTPASSSIISITLGWYVDGKKFILAGARGTWKMDLKAGEPGVIHFEFLGTAIEDSDTALLSGVSYQTTNPPAFMSASFTLAAYAGIIESMSIDMGNALYLRPSANAAQGFISTVITGREPKLTINPEDVLVATKDWWAIWEAGTLSALSAVVGATAGNICTITAPKVQIGKMKPAERDGIVVQEMECELSRNSGDDEISLALT